MPRITFIRSAFVYVLVAVCSPAQTAKANLCDASAHLAAQETRVPVEVLLTITRVETGRHDRQNDPWPWTVNHAGNGTWFPTEDAARKYVFSRVKNGESNLDIGCFQINYRWHADGFRDLDAMFDPDLNALYAAKFLATLHAEFGDWTEAVGAYHSRTPQLADRYKDKFREFRARLTDTQIQDRKPPLTQASWIEGGHTARAGSLFVADGDNVAPLIDLGGSR